MIKEGLGFGSCCWSCVKVSSKLLITCCIWLSRSNGYIVEWNIASEWFKMLAYLYGVCCTLLMDVRLFKYLYLYPGMQWSTANYGHSKFNLYSVPLNKTLSLLGHYYWFQRTACYFVCITLKRNCIVQWAINLWWLCYWTEMKCSRLTWLAYVGVAQSCIKM